MALTQVRPEGLGFVNGKRNLIINGAMQVAQRGTSATTYSNSGGFGAADRISFRRGGTWTTTTFDLSQEDTSGLDEFPKCSQIKVQDAVANPNANDGTFCNFRYALEGNEIQHLQYGTSNAKDVTLSFYIKSPVTGTYCVHFEINHAAANYVAEYTINSANTWEYKTITVPAPSTSELGTKPTNDNNIQLAIYWILSGNTTGTSTARGSAGWSGTEPDRTRYTVNQANAFSTLNNAVQLTGCQLEVGTNASDFEHESYGETLKKCHRYFQRHDNVSGVTLQCYNTTDAYTFIQYPDGRMRASASATVNYSSGDTIAVAGSGKTISAREFTGSNRPNGATFKVTASGLTAGYAAHYDKDASNIWQFDAEL